MGFDNLVDNRWRPDFEGSRRRVREEEADESDAGRGRIVVSRELSFVPAGKRPEFEPHDRQTQVMIDEHTRLEKLRHGESVVPRLDEWRWIDAMQPAEVKQRYLEPLIAAVRRDPAGNEDLLVFLLIVFEPVRRGVSARFMRARGGLSPDVDADWSNKTEARLIREIDKQTLYDVTRGAALEAVFRYPNPPPQRIFPWLRETLAYRTLDRLRQDLSEIETTVYNAAEAAALQEALAGFEAADGPSMGDAAGLREWRGTFNIRGLYEAVDAYFDETSVRQACKSAVGRLPERQAEVIDGVFFRKRTPLEIAVARRVSRSTIYNTQAHAIQNLHDDDGFFSALSELGIVRDRVRAAGIAARYPGGRMPDGRRIVPIDQAA